MDKSSLIEFKLNEKNFEKFYFSMHYKDLDLIYISIHSTQSVFSASNFHPMNIIFKSNVDLFYKFSKSYVQNLEWPYRTNCIKSKTEDGLTYNFDDCFNSCILNKKIQRYGCIHSKNNFNIDILLNKGTEKIKVCNKSLEVLKKLYFPQKYTSNV
jgi:hypothetical protein